MIGSWPSTSAHKGGVEMPEPLTTRQRETPEYLRFRQKIRSYPPTVREIGEAVRPSTRSTAPNPSNTLERQGQIPRDTPPSPTIQALHRAKMPAQLNKGGART